MRVTYRAEGVPGNFSSAYMAKLYAMDARAGIETRITRSDGRLVAILWPGQR